MKKLILSYILISSSIALAEFPTLSYCNNPQFKSETKFEGKLFTPGMFGRLTYLGSNRTNSSNVGYFTFFSETSFAMEFAGEQRHFCNLDEFPVWQCSMGNLRYKLNCPEWVSK